MMRVPPQGMLGFLDGGVSVRFSLSRRSLERCLLRFCSVHWRLLLLFSCLCMGSDFGFAAGHELKFGRYVGFIQLDDTHEKVAVITDTFIVQPANFIDFPKLNAIIKMSLGGYGTAEYVSEIFTDVAYDFNSGVLSMDEPANDLVISAIANSTEDGVTVNGQVWIRSAAKSGRLYLELETDEPGDQGDGDDGSTGTFFSTLQGQYEGQCGSEHAALQITTGKGLADDGPEQRGLHGYGLVARLAFDDAETCGVAGTSPGQPVWCVARAFPSGSYNFFGGRLTLDADNGSTSCDVFEGHLTCQVRMVDSTIDCDLQKTDMTVARHTSSSRSYSVQTTAAQRQELPEPLPPEHADLVQALRGQFFGYMHNESTNQYQPMRLNVIPSVSTLNPHDENRVFVSTAVVTHFGRNLSAEFWPQQLDKTPFYIRPGFTLESAGADGFLQIEEWRTGYIRGTWISHAFGRVGTVQLLKGTALPPLNVAADVVGSIRGEYTGRIPGGTARDPYRWFKTIFPTQPVGRDNGTFTFTGDTQLSGGIITPIRIAHGTYDVYTRAISWLTAETTPRLASGLVSSDGSMSLLWPGASKWGIRMSDYGFIDFAHPAE